MLLLLLVVEVALIPAFAQMAEVNEFVSLAGVGVPPIVETTTSLLSSADYALQAIPI